MLKIFRQLYKLKPYRALKFNDEINITFFPWTPFSARAEQTYALDAILSGKVRVALTQ